MDFLATIQLSPEQKEARRLAALRLLEEGWSQADVSRELGVSDSAVNRWAQAASVGGAEALKRRPHTGRPAKLAKAENATQVRKRPARIPIRRVTTVTAARLSIQKGAMSPAPARRTSKGKSAASETPE